MTPLGATIASSPRSHPARVIRQGEAMTERPTPDSYARPLHETSASRTATIWPISFAIGIAVTLVGLIVNPEVIAPLGGAITILAAFAWMRGGGSEEEPTTSEETASQEAPPSVDRYPRSRFLERATVGLGAIIAGAVALPAVGLAVLPSLLGQQRRSVDLGSVSAFPEGRFVVATFLADPKMGEVSRRAAYIRNNGSLGGLPSFTAMSSRCTHVGCPTQPNGPTFIQQRHVQKTANGEIGLVPALPAGGFGCPCHGSQFDTEGNRTAGPAPRALDRYEFSIRNGHLWLDHLFSVSHVEGQGANARIHRFSLRGAGEPADGPESWLYPVDPIR
jgi:Rieske Fe-S protein